MNHATNCQFCKRPITLEIDDSYAELGDIHKLIPMAACNRCADLRVERRTLEAKIKHVCMMRAFSKRKPSDEENEKATKVLTKLTQDYANMVARWHERQGMAWDEECVALLLEKPQQWFDILGNLWRMYRQWEAQGEPAQ